MDNIRQSGSPGPSLRRQDNVLFYQETTKVGRTQSFRDVRAHRLEHQNSFDKGSAVDFTEEVSAAISAPNIALDRRAVAHDVLVGSRTQLHELGRACIASHEEVSPCILSHVENDEVSPAVHPLVSELLSTRAILASLKQNNVDAARLSYDALDIANRLNKARQGKKSDDLITGLSEQLIKKQHELLSVVKFGMEVSGQTAMPFYKQVQAGYDELDGCLKGNITSGENLCWQRVVENKGTFGSHSLGGGLFLLGIVSLTIGVICLANGNAEVVERFFMSSTFSITNFTATTVAPTDNDSDGCQAIPALIIGGG